MSHAHKKNFEMKNIYKISLSFIFIIAVPLKAQWIQTYGPPGGVVNAILISDPVIFAAANSVDGIYRSIDDGATWMQMSTCLTSYGATYSIAVHGNDLVVGTNAGVWRRPLSKLTAVDKTSDTHKPA